MKYTKTTIPMWDMQRDLNAGNLFYEYVAGKFMPIRTLRQLADKHGDDNVFIGELA